jgi:hypothetical protein
MEDDVVWAANARQGHLDTGAGCLHGSDEDELMLVAHDHAEPR